MKDSSADNAAVLSPSRRVCRGSIAAANRRFRGVYWQEGHSRALIVSRKTGMMLQWDRINRLEIRRSVSVG